MEEGGGIGRAGMGAHRKGRGWIGVGDSYLPLATSPAILEWQPTPPYVTFAGIREPSQPCQTS